MSVPRSTIGGNECIASHHPGIGRNGSLTYKSKAKENNYPQNPFFIMDWLEQLDVNDIARARIILQSTGNARIENDSAGQNARRISGNKRPHSGNSSFQDRSKESRHVGYHNKRQEQSREEEERGEAMARDLNERGRQKARIGRWEEALQFWAQSLQIRKATTSRSYLDPDVADTLSDIGIAYGKLDLFDEAIQYLTEALRIRKKLFGKNHMSCAATLHNMGNVLQNAGEYDRALKLFVGARRIKQDILGLSHPQVAFAIKAIGHVYYEIGLYDKAWEAYSEALKVYRRAGLNDDHPDVVQTLFDIADVENIFATNTDFPMF